MLVEELEHNNSEPAPSKPAPPKKEPEVPLPSEKPSEFEDTSKYLAAAGQLVLCVIIALTVTYILFALFGSKKGFYYSKNLKKGGFSNPKIYPEDLRIAGVPTGTPQPNQSQKTEEKMEFFILKKMIFNDF